MRGLPVGSPSGTNALYAPVASEFIDFLAQICGNLNTESYAPANTL